MKYIYAILLLCFLTCINSTGLYSQFNNTLYWMHHLPQSGQHNIALQPAHRFYFGVPALSSFQVGFNHTGFALNDIVSRDQNNQLVFDNDKLVSTVNKKNHLIFNFQLELLSFGFTQDKNTFSFSASEKMAFDFGYSADFIRFLNYGNKYFIDADRSIDFSGTGFDILHYREFGVGYTRQITDYLIGGIRAKFIFGLSNLWIEKNDLSLYTDPNTIGMTAYADFLANISGPVGVSSSNNNDFKAAEYVTNTHNRGIAFDFGLAYQPVQDLTLAFSYIDAGVINWINNVENIRLNGEFTFNGFDINDLVTNSDNQMDILDSLKQELNYTESFNSYRTSLPRKLYFSAAYDLNEKHKFSLLTGSRYHNDNTHRTLSASYYYYYISDVACISTTYSIIHGNYHNFGLGMNLNVGSFQFYIISDNILGMMRPHLLQSANIHFGINIVIDQQRRDSLLQPHLSIRQIRDARREPGDSTSRI